MILLDNLTKDQSRHLVRQYPQWKSWWKINGLPNTQPSLAQCKAFVAQLPENAQTTPKDTTPMDQSTANTLPQPHSITDLMIEQQETANAALDAAKPETSELETILGDASAYIHPTYLDAAKSRLADVLKDTASKAAIEAVQDYEAVTRSTPAPAQETAGSPVSAPAIHAPRRILPRIVTQSTLGKTFGISNSRASREVDIWNTPLSDVPVINSAYVFAPDVLHVVMASIKRGKNVWLAGPKGAGKSTLVEQIAARTQRHCVTISFHAQTEPSTLIGGLGMANGSTYLKDGALLAAMRCPGSLICLDELDNAPPAIAAGLLSILASGFVVVPETGERVHCAPGVVFIATGNTAGSGDNTGLYNGTREQNAALLDRFAVSIDVDYLPENLERLALAKTLGLKPAQVAPFTVFAELTRNAFKRGDNGDCLSFRGLVAWIEARLDDVANRVAFELTVQNKMRPDFGLKVRELFNADFDATLADCALFEKPIPAPAPAPSAAGSVFPGDDTETMFR